jgi:integrase
LSFDNLLKKKLNEPVFLLEDGTATKSLAGTFRNLMRDSGLDKDRVVKEKRTLYSLRHTYAHFALLTDKMDVYTLARQMGTSVKMIEQHYGHLNPAMKADVIAGKRIGAKKTNAAEKTAMKTKIKMMK